jgi:hypothetical protein
MVAQSEQVFLALAQGRGAADPAVTILEYKELKPFFVVDGSDAPASSRMRQKRTC